MRTEEEIRQKIIELCSTLKELSPWDDVDDYHTIKSMIRVLEWVLNE